MELCNYHSQKAAEATLFCKLSECCKIVTSEISPCKQAHCLSSDSENNLPAGVILKYELES